MNKEEKIYPYKRSGKTYEKLKAMAGEISKLQKENSELTNELKHISKLFGENTKRLETISRKLGLTKKNEYGFLYDEIIKEINKLQKELDKKDKLIELIYNLFYEYISIRPMSGIKFLNDKGFSKCKNCEKELEDENGISCKDCIKEQFIKKVEEEND